MALPEFATIPASEMAKPKTYSKVSSEVTAEREAYDKFLASLAKSGQGGVVKTNDTDRKPRSIRMQLRYASNRTGLEIKNFVVANGEVQFLVSNKAPATQPAQ